jgi:hypothetical protein
MALYICCTHTDIPETAQALGWKFDIRCYYQYIKTHTELARKKYTLETIGELQTDILEQTSC